jgi:hypothetical protein
LEFWADPGHEFVVPGTTRGGLYFDRYVLDSLLSGDLNDNKVLAGEEKNPEETVAAAKLESNMETKGGSVSQRET